MIRFCANVPHKTFSASLRREVETNLTADKESEERGGPKIIPEAES